MLQKGHIKDHTKGQTKDQIKDHTKDQTKDQTKGHTKILLNIKFKSERMNSSRCSDCFAYRAVVPGRVYLVQLCRHKQQVSMNVVIQSITRKRSQGSEGATERSI